MTHELPADRVGPAPALGDAPVDDAPMWRSSSYPATRRTRDRFVVTRRGSRPAHDPWRHQGVLVEPERAADGRIETAATVFLTGRECPWRCVMCDLWQGTTAEDTPLGAIPSQVADAVATLRESAPHPTVIKLYNAGSFFDRRAVPAADHPAIADHLRPFSRVIVEAHPLLVGDATWRLRDALAARRPGVRLEVAIGLETAHPAALDALNKHITLDDVAAAARALHAHDVDLRLFLLVHPPFIPPAEQSTWLARSVRYASDCGATAISLIPTRPGEGALAALAADGLFTPPRLGDVEGAAGIGLTHATCRTFVDTWDLGRLADCQACAAPRLARLCRVNLEQQLPDVVTCPTCGGGEAS